MTFLTRRWMLAAGATLPAALGARNSWGLGAPGAATLGGSGPRFGDADPGKPVPPIEFKTGDGATVTLSDYQGRGIVLNFWATWCAPCVREMPALAKLAGLVKEANVVVLPLSSDRGGAPVVERYFQEKQIAGLPVLLDPHGDAAHSFDLQGIPTTLLIDAKGRERARYVGAADWADPAAVAAVKELGRVAA